MTSSPILSDCVSYVEAYRRFMTLESPVASVSDTNSKAYQEELSQSLQYMKKCIYQRQLDGVLSSNEHFLELQNTQLYAFCIEYYLGMLIPKQKFFQQVESVRTQEQVKQTEEEHKQRSGVVDHARNVVCRIKFLNESDVFLTEFLDRAERFNIITKKERREQYERLENKQFSLSRDDKIQRFRLQRDMEKKLQEVQKRREEKKDSIACKAQKEDMDELGEVNDNDVDDLEREQLMTFIQLSVLKCMEEQASNNQEKEMLETMWKMNAATDKQDLFSEVHRPPPPCQGQGIEVTCINPQMEMRRETIRSGVFQPGHRLPTMTIEEYADHEVADAVERQKREQEAPKGPRRYDQLAEDEDEDNDALVEKATYKDRAWDDWKDANEKGIGNKKGSQF